VAFNQIVSEGKVYGLEFTVRPGINGSYCTWNLLRPPYGEIFQKWANKTLKEIPLHPTKVSAGLTFAIYPYPLAQCLQDHEMTSAVFDKSATGTYVTDVDSDLWKNPNLFFIDVKREENEIVCAGADGLIAFNAQSASTISMAQAQALEDAHLFDHMSEFLYKKDGCSRIMEVRQLVDQKLLSWMPAF
jgi:hypothetical protein